MIPMSQTALTELERAIWRTVAYADLFDFPMTAAEIHRYLEEVPATARDVTQALLSSPTLSSHLRHKNGYFYLPDRDDLIGVRQARKQRAQQLWPEALHYGRLIAQLPFVRMVAVTGSLAVNNVGNDADIDYFIVTEDGRLWLSRALIVGVVRLAARRGVVVCPNYFVAESALALPEHTLYTAREIAQMVPLFGDDVYQKLRQQNAWSCQFMPNAAGAPPNQPISRPLNARYQKLAERPLRTRLGRWLERWEQARKIDKLSKQKNGSGESNFSATICKGHFQAHQQRTLTAYERHLTSAPRLPMSLYETPPNNRK